MQIFATVEKPDSIAFVQQPADATGVGIIQHWFNRTCSNISNDNNTSLGFLPSDFTDAIAVQPSADYVYAEQERGYHGLYSGNHRKILANP